MSATATAAATSTGERGEHGEHDSQVLDNLSAKQKHIITSLREQINVNAGKVIVSAPGKEEGYWVGAPSASYDYENKCFYLVYRTRRPRESDPKELDRGGKVTIVRVNNIDSVMEIEELWSINRTMIQSLSCEKACLVHCEHDGLWRLYISYVSAADNHWRIEYVEASHPSKFSKDRSDFVTIEVENLPENIQGMKDPCIFYTDHGDKSTMHMFFSFAVPVADGEGDGSMHSSGDCFNTQRITSRTGHCVSVGVDPAKSKSKFEYIGEPLKLGTDGSWDSFCTRISSVRNFKSESEKMLIAFYDGSAPGAANYEERAGMAVTTYIYDDLSLPPFQPFRFERVAEAMAGPLFTSSVSQSGSCRYIETVQVEDEVHLFFEYACEDGSHDLRYQAIQSR